MHLSAFQLQFLGASPPLIAYSSVGVHAAVCSSLRKFPQYSLVITGHSLGNPLVSRIVLPLTSPSSPVAHVMHAEHRGRYCHIAVSPLGLASNLRHG